MNRFKKHKVKIEKPETSTSHTVSSNDYDLTYFIHDRVELMHQVFSVLKHKDLKAMAPECVRHISIDDLQELCTEELLGISSKRLCAILDGAEPPSDTESSSESPERLETISLDSISSDEEILSETSSSKKHKKHRRHHRDKGKKKKTKDTPEKEADTEQSRAARAGLTVLELLELQARARAIRAQLQQEQANRKEPPPDASTSMHSSDNEVEIKEEPAEVVEISSEDEKPDVKKLAAKPTTTTKEQTQVTDNGQSVTKRINDLIITVPQTKQSRKIKLNRAKSITVAQKETTTTEANTSTVTIENAPTTNKETDNIKGKDNEKTNGRNDLKIVKQTKKAAKTKKKLKKRDRKITEDKDSDQDEITLQLSDTEKMDLLEGLDRKTFDKVSSSGSEDSDSSSSDSSSEEERKEETVVNTKQDEKVANKHDNDTVNKPDDNVEEITDDKSNDSGNSETRTENNSAKTTDSSSATKDSDASSPKPNDLETASRTTPTIDSKMDDDTSSPEKKEALIAQDNEITKSPKIIETDKARDSSSNSPDKGVEVVTIDDTPIINEESMASKPDSPKNNEKDEENRQDRGDDATKEGRDDMEEVQESEKEKQMSDGEISEKESSEVEAFDLQPEVVCISDTEETDAKKKSEKKKKKKEKKSKSKKSKKSKSDFRESADQNFFEENKIDITGDETEKKESVTKDVIKIEDNVGINSISLDDDDDVYEILELSDDSSCYEVEGTVLSKEPTAEEIEALSAKIDEIEREDVVTEAEIREHERNNENPEDLKNISWKDRYLDSKKVKRVLTTSNILNALRKRNRQLKKKLEESKKKAEPAEKAAEDKLPEEKESEVATNLEEGSIEYYNTLQGSTKFVDPVKEIVDTENQKDVVENDKELVNGNSGSQENIQGYNSEGIVNNGENTTETPQVVKEMRKEAKQILKMYKKLLKYNDINKQKDPNRKKDPNKKKKKKSKKKEKDGGAGKSDIVS